MNKEIQDLISARVQMTAWIRFRMEDGDRNVIRADMVDKVFISRMTEVFQGSDLCKIIKEMFVHMKTQVKNSALTNSRFVFNRDQ